MGNVCLRAGCVILKTIRCGCVTEARYTVEFLLIFGEMFEMARSRLFESASENLDQTYLCLVAR